MVKGLKSKAAVIIEETKREIHLKLDGQFAKTSMFQGDKPTMRTVILDTAA